MFDKLFNFILSKTDLEIVLEKIANQDQVRNANIVISLRGEVKEIDLDKDLRFMVGKRCWTIDSNLQYKYFTVNFDDKDEKCIISMSGDKEPLFAFSDVDEIKQIREAIKSKYNEWIAKKKRLLKKDFKDM